jgi:transposase
MWVIKELRPERRILRTSSILFDTFMKEFIMYFVGIDWADEKHDICILSQDGKIISRFTIPHSHDGFLHLKAVLQSLGKSQLCIERPDGLLVDFLVQQDWEIYLVPPRATAARRGRKSKNDQRDAQLLANMLRMVDPDCHPLNRSSNLVLKLKRMVRVFDQLQADQKRLNNRLIHLLKLYYPAALQLFRNVYFQITLDFLKTFPNPEAARQAGLEGLNRFFYARRYNSRPKIPAFHARLQAPQPTATEASGSEYAMLRLVALMETINTQLGLIEKDIVATFKQHPDAAWWLQFPGIGYMTGARLLATMGDNRQRFPTLNSLQATAGTVPVTVQSGRQYKVSFRNECSKLLRRAVTDWARNSLRYSAWAKAYFNQQVARGHEKQRAYRALANRWLSVLWKLWKSGEFYDQAIHEANSKILVSPLTEAKQTRKVS